VSLRDKSRQASHESLDKVRHKSLAVQVIKEEKGSTNLSSLETLDRMSLQDKRDAFAKRLASLKLIKD